jgi:hypothetical protein
MVPLPREDGLFAKNGGKNLPVAFQTRAKKSLPPIDSFEDAAKAMIGCGNRKLPGRAHDILLELCFTQKQTKTTSFEVYVSAW